ncbi:hypothetical protein EAH79_01070 [Sphingomonas koreensis]|nr:hypothetical protein EAH79_01070 [Sphingomonas koreensis]
MRRRGSKSMLPANRAARRRARVIGIAAAAVLSVAAAPQRPKTSWGKPGVSLADYRADSIACARQAADLDVSKTGAAQALVTASHQLDHPIDLAAAQQAMDLARPEQRFAEVARLQKQALEQCLRGRGYRPFALNKAQRDRLGKLSYGSDERRTYLYKLASDPEVQRAQAAEIDAKR